ncbi:MAG TPA: efflux RND transporter periplasmic adaptor subunit [Chthoniobacterales bacterium]
MTSSILRSLSILFLLAAPAVLAQEKAPEKTTVRTVTPTVAQAGRPYEIPGRTEPFESATVFTRATGIIRERKFDIGDVVKAGDVLAVVDIPEIDQAVDAARATVDQVTARARIARSLSDRSATLLKSRNISIEEADQRISAAVETEAAVRVAQAELGRLEEQQKFAVVRAPFDAVIAARNFDRGDRVRGDAATSEGWLYRLVRLDALRVAINATPDLALRLSKDSEAKLRFTEFPGRSFPAKVARSSQLFDTATGTMRVELMIENKDLILPAGLTGTAAFDLAPAPGTFLVPTNTLVIRAGKATVAAVDNGKVAFLDVLPGRNLGPNVEVTSGSLTANTQVIINPNALLRAGDPVEIAPTQTAKR